MRNGVLGAMLIVLAGAGLAFGQYPPPGGSIKNPDIIPPPLPGMGAGGDPNLRDPNAGGAGPSYPPSANWDAFNPNGSQGSDDHYVPHVWANLEYLMWFPKGVASSAPLITTGDPINQGATGAAATKVLAGLDHQDYNLTSGYRISGGAFFDDAGRLGFGVSAFQLEQRAVGMDITSTATGMPLLARPFFDTFIGVPSSLVVSSPTLGPGQVFVTNTLNVYGVEGNVISTLYRSAPDNGFGYSIGVLGGFRFLSVAESTEVASSTQLFPGNSVTINGLTYSPNATSSVGLTSTGGTFFNPVVITTSTLTNTSTQVAVDVIDEYKVRNQFYGGNVGLFQQMELGRFFLGLTGKIGLGDMHQIVDVIGVTNVPVTTSSSTQSNSTSLFTASNTTIYSQGVANNPASGGLLAQSNQVGRYQRDSFAVVPELNFTVGYQISPIISVFLGYNMIYVSKVTRPNDLINGQSSSALQPTSANFGSATVGPSFSPFPVTGFWIQGLNVGLAFRY